MSVPIHLSDYSFDKQTFLDLEKCGRSGLIEIHLTSGLVTLSKRYQENFSRDFPIEMKMDSFHDLFNPDELPEVKKQVGIAINDAIPVVIEYSWRHPKSPRMVRLKIKPYRNEAGQVDRLMGIQQDIILEGSEIKEPKNGLIRFYEDELEAIYSTAPVGLCVIDVNLRFVRINQLLASINGFTVEEHLGKTIREMLPGFADEVEPIMRKIIEDDQPILNIELKGETNADPGVEKIWSENWFPLKNTEGEIIGINVVAYEVTESRMREATLRKYQEELAATNRELEISNSKLKASNTELNDIVDRLNKVNADLDNFVLTASHDLKTPIANIQGLIHLLTRSLSSDSLSSKVVQDSIKMMEQMVERFMKTINNLGNITRLQQTSELPPEKVNVLDVVEEVKLDLDILIKKNHALVKVDLPHDLFLNISMKNLRSLFYNLLSNALKYRDPDRHPTIHIDYVDSEKDVTLIISDNGLGMDIEGNPELFTLFYRMHDHVEGTGVGLYIVKKIVDNADGTLKVESTVGEGTTFFLTLPKY